jgi:hypothetical protein
VISVGALQLGIAKQSITKEMVSIMTTVAVWIAKRIMVKCRRDKEGMLAKASKVRWEIGFQ